VAALVPQSPEWWVQRLWKRLQLRRPAIDFYSNYYLGDFPLPWLHPDAQVEFARLLQMCRSNFMGLVVDAQVERMNIDGFRLSNNTDGASDEDLWKIWQYNDMDAEYDKGLLEATITGNMYLLVTPNKDDEKFPHIDIEHPNQAIVEYVPGTARRERAAGLKAWVDDWTGEVHATLYLKDGVYKFRTNPVQRVDDSNLILGTLGSIDLVAPEWFKREVSNETWPAKNPVGVVPLFESPNNPRLLTGGRSELEDVTDIQDRIVKTVADRLMTQDFGAFHQKWISGWPQADEAGNPTPNINIGRDRVITTDVPEAQFGQFDSDGVKELLEATDADIKHIASRTRTPAQYLLGDMSNVNGETLAASESGLVSKVRQRMRGHSNAVEQVMRLAREMGGYGKIDAGVVMETIWHDPEHRTKGEVMDAAVKARQGLEVPIEGTWEMVGFSQAQISRFREMRKQEQKEQQQQDSLAMLTDRFRQGGAAGQPSQPGQPAGRPGGQGQTRERVNPQTTAKPNGITS
jgi:Phage portal protein, SPP1 Gp6-like